jgi:hypothetical protein
MVATRGEEQLHQDIAKKIEQGGEGLAEEDRWMLEVNLGDLEQSSGVKEGYWLLAIQMTRERYQIRNTMETT